MPTHISNESDYRRYYDESLQEMERFWSEQAQQWITWFAPWQHVLSGKFGFTQVNWFEGAKVNAAYNCLDRHLNDRADQIAIYWEGDQTNQSQTLTYQELYERVCQFANVLKNYGVKKGDRICIYLPMIPEAAIAMLACTRIGAIHSVVFAGFSAEALKTRILDADCSLVITANESVRGGKSTTLKLQVDTALRQCPRVRTVIVVKRTETVTPMQAGRDWWYHEVILDATTDCPPSEMDALDPLFILYTSGSTGKPKGILHSTGGYLVYTAITFNKVFDYQPGEIFWCTADVGWITGHSYSIYGPLLNGATLLLYEGTPTYPTPSRFWEIIDKYNVNIFYTAPTAIRALRKEGDDWVNSTKRTSLRILGTVGEPINPEAWQWYYQVVGNSQCYIVDTWWQTETGGVMISPLPNVTPLKPGSAAWPFFGIAPLVVNDNGKPAKPGEMGKLVITKPWPGMMQTIYGDPTRVFSTYFKEFPGLYLTGDQAIQDEEGYYWIAGRSDDVIKISGHRIGTQEVESAFIQHPAVAEAAVVAIADTIKGQAIYAFITLRESYSSSEQLKKELVQTVRTVIGAIASPKQIQWAQALPKTRSGKIMRRLLRKIASNEMDELGDISTLADPDVVKDLIEGSRNLQNHEVKE